jgi:hypothetical protein
MERSEAVLLGALLEAAEHQRQDYQDQHDKHDPQQRAAGARLRAVPHA